MDEEERRSFVAKEPVNKADAKLVKRSIGKDRPLIVSSPKQEDM